MQKNGTAYFVQYPRIIEELNVIHPLDWESPYEVVKEIYLQAIDFENFITDMTVDRQFIEDHAALCEDGETKKCLLIRGRDPRIGILVIPDAERYVGWAALVRDDAKKRRETVITGFPARLFQAAEAHDELILPVPYLVHFFRHIQQIGFVHIAAAVCSLSHLIEIVADAAQEAVHFFDRRIVHFQKETVQRHLSDVGGTVICFRFLHALMNHVQLSPRDRHFDDDFLFCRLFLHGYLSCPFFWFGCLSF